MQVARRSQEEREAWAERSQRAEQKIEMFLFRTALGRLASSGASSTLQRSIATSVVRPRAMWCAWMRRSQLARGPSEEQSTSALGSSALLESGACGPSRLPVVQVALEGELAQAAGPKEFTDLWNKKAPQTLGVPELPSNFISDKGSESKVQGDLFPVNFFTPSSVVAEGKQVRALATLQPGECSAPARCGVGACRARDAGGAHALATRHHEQAHSAQLHGPAPPASDFAARVLVLLQHSAIWLVIQA